MSPELASSKPCNKSGGIQPPKSHGEFHLCTVSHQAPPPWDRKSQRHKVFGKSSWWLYAVLPPVQIPQAYKENTSTNPGYSNPAPESLLLDGKVIPLSIEGCFRQHVPCSACPQYFSFAQWRSVRPPCAKQFKSLHVPVVFIFLLPTEKWIIFPVVRMVFCLNYQEFTGSRFLAATQPSSTHHSDSQCFHTWRGTWINSGGADKKHILKLRISPLQIGGWVVVSGMMIALMIWESKEPTFWLFEGSSWRFIYTVHCIYIYMNNCAYCDKENLKIITQQLQINLPIQPCTILSWLLTVSLLPFCSSETRVCNQLRQWLFISCLLQGEETDTHHLTNNHLPPAKMLDQLIPSIFDYIWAPTRMHRHPTAKNLRRKKMQSSAWKPGSAKKMCWVVQ